MQIAALRKALGQSDDGQGWILTVPRVGYRLVAGGPDTSAPPLGLADEQHPRSPSHTT